MAYQKIKGTLDFFDDSSNELRYVEEIIRKEIKKRNFNEIITPIIENTNVFVKSSGESSDIVNKEMYTFKDRGENSITLRPEGTAGAVRSYLENKLYVEPGIKKLFYFGPMFRYEKPQAGRFRQFIQFGVEAFGESNYLLDVDVIISAYKIFETLGIKGVELNINCIGDFASRSNYTNKLREYFKDQITQLCPDCQRRLLTNPMRILDCKVDKNNDILLNAPKISESLTEASKEYFSNLLSALDYLNIPYSVNENLVRGLDYYTDTVFEYILRSEESELNDMAICAGGKYADLVSSFGGPNIPGIGYAFGVERIVSLMKKQNLFKDLETKLPITIISLDMESKKYSMILGEKLRNNDFIIEMDYKNCAFKQQFKLSERMKSKLIIIIGEEERKNDCVAIKNTYTGKQEVVKIENIIGYLKENE